jgi:hypothetical protein
MNVLFFKLKENLGLSLILFIGLGVEFSNFQAMFFRFMSSYRPNWGAFNHLPAIFLSAFLLLCIVIFGIRKQITLSWFLALLTCVISFSVYSRMNLSWEWEAMHEIHFVVLILSGMLPMLVAYTTHQIAQSDETEFYENLLNGGGNSTKHLQAKHKPHAEQGINFRQQRQSQGFEQNPMHTQREQPYMHADTHAHTNMHTQAPYNPATEKEYAFEQDLGQRRKNHVSYEVSPMIKPEKTAPTMPPKVETELPKILHCEECGTAMPDKRKGTKYCSKTCVVSAQKRRRSIEQANLADLQVKKVMAKSENLQPNFSALEFEKAEKMQATAMQPITKPIMQTTMQTTHKASIDFESDFRAKEVVFDSKQPVLETKKVVANENLGAETSFTCDYCGKKAERKNIHSRYCSEVCRISALRTRQKSDFFVQTDDFDTNGVIAWKNPAKN